VFQDREDRSGKRNIEACVALGERRTQKLEHVCPESTAYEGNWRNQALSLIDLGKAGFECNGDLPTACIS
jgi:hypothetical protein